VQQTHSLSVTVRNAGAAIGELALTLAMNNIFDSPVYDVLGVQRPGRTLNAKVRYVFR
jgi:outer membrane receptor protein involved in Fe transport